MLCPRLLSHTVSLESCPCAILTTWLSHQGLHCRPHLCQNLRSNLEIARRKYRCSKRLAGPNVRIGVCSSAPARQCTTRLSTYQFPCFQILILKCMSYTPPLDLLVSNQEKFRCVWGKRSMWKKRAKFQKWPKKLFYFLLRIYYAPLYLYLDCSRPTNSRLTFSIIWSAKRSIKSTKNGMAQKTSSLPDTL